MLNNPPIDYREQLEKYKQHGRIRNAKPAELGDLSSALGPTGPRLQDDGLGRTMEQEQGNPLLNRRRLQDDGLGRTMEQEQNNPLLNRRR